MESLRRRVRVELDCCRLCGNISGGKLPGAAVEIGIAHSTLWRFLQDGKGLSGASLNKLMAWLEAAEGKRTKAGS